MTMNRRTGMTLMEVLIAIFVMGIGLLAVMAMFPLGAASMARAIKDDRAGHAAANAKALAIALNVRFDLNVTSKFNSAFPLDGPSNPVFADPLGYLSYSASSGTQTAIAGMSGNGGIPRCTIDLVDRPPPTMTKQQAALKWCSMLDDITFGTDGKPYLQTGTGYIERAGAFTYAWMLQRPKAGNAQCCNASVLVYHQRPISSAGLLSSKEVAYPNSVIDALNNGAEGPPKHNLVTLTWSSGTPAPKVSEGSWVLDLGPKVSAKVPPLATFHRVVSVGDTTTLNGANALPIELAQPLRFYQGTPPHTIVTMDGVAEVIDCGPGWKSGAN
jgi:prepilin-type N-terminal cleavage/methylation domain-containing protein